MHLPSLYIKKLAHNAKQFDWPWMFFFILNSFILLMNISIKEIFKTVAAML